MPQTKFQSIVFTFITAALMCYLMIVYNMALNNGELTGSAFLSALKEFPLEFVIVFVLAFFCAGFLAKRLALRIIDPSKDNPFFFILAIQSFTVCIMVPLMSLYAALINSLNAQFFFYWLQAVCLNFIMAYPLQIFIVGPLARALFRLIFKRSLSKDKENKGNGEKAD